MARATFKASIELKLSAEDVIDIAKEAGERILAIYNAGPEAFNVQSKEDDSPFTAADREANSVICQRLMETAPHVPIVSEENIAVPHETRKKYQYSWCVDPLDGTREFVKRNGQFTVNIALLRGEKPVLGVVHTPVHGTTHWAMEGEGAYKRQSPSGKDEALGCSEFDTREGGLTIVGSATHSNQATEEFVSRFASPSFTQLGSSLKLLLVAEGDAHIYPRLAPTSEWDTAAAHCIVEEAGGAVLQAGETDEGGSLLPGVEWESELTREKPVVYNKANPRNPYFVVYGKASGPRLPPSPPRE